jgi:hypothetical protein
MLLSFIIIIIYMSSINKLEEHYDDIDKFKHYFYLVKDARFNPSHLLNVWKKLVEGLTSMDTKDACLNNIHLLLTHDVPLLNFHYDNQVFTMLIEDVEPGIFYYIVSRLKHPDYFSGFYAYDDVHYTLNQDINDNCPIMTCIQLMTQNTKKNEEYRLKLLYMVEKLIEYGGSIDFPVMSLQGRKISYTNPLRYAMEHSCESAISVLQEYGATTAIKVKRKDRYEPCYYNFVDFSETSMNRLNANKTRTKIRKILQTRKNKNQIKRNTQTAMKLIARTNSVNLNAPNNIEAVKQRIASEKSKEPCVVVGGVGGSGTRLISSLLATLGLNIGTDLNEAYDNLTYTLLFKHLNVNETNIQSYYDLLYKTIKAEPYELSQDELAILSQLTQHGRPGHPRYWLDERAENVVRISKEGPLENEHLNEIPPIREHPLKGQWGWKEPNTHTIFPWLHEHTKNTKFIMVVRNGLDMAFSDNKNQFILWGPSVIPKELQKFDKYGRLIYTPELSMKYWTLVHKKVLGFGKRIGKRFLMINFDDMCLHKEKWLKILCDFLEISDNVIPELTPQIVYQSKSIGRFKKEDISKFDPEDIKYAKSLGFDTETTHVSLKKNHNVTQKIIKELQPYRVNYPYAVIGAVGGSGTRLIASILYALGMNMGNYLNEAFDNNVFVFLFRRVQTLGLSDKEFNFYMNIMYKTFHPGMKLTNEENKLIDKLSLTMGQQFTKRKLREHADRIKQMIQNGPDKGLSKETREMFQKIEDGVRIEDKPLASKWGWKAPNSHVIMKRLHHLYPKMKYIMVIRNGLDMAFSDNKNQLELWGPKLFKQSDMEEPNWAESPRLALKYWCIVYKKILKEAEEMGRQFYLLRYEELCENPSETMKELLNFLEVEPTKELVDILAGLVKKSEGIGRFRTKDLSQFDPEDVAYVKELGFPVS